MSDIGLFASWNIRGLGSFEKKSAVKRLLSLTKPRVLFLQETKMKEIDDKAIRSLVGHRAKFNSIYSAANGSSGGLITLWDPNFLQIENSISEPNFIAIYGKLTESNIMCLLINVYAPNDHFKRKDNTPEYLFYNL
ncbi:hypothetical protein HRI_002227400 [Hibiscus trionum]|uniref:RNA-directed DNA polymerase, eukaryota, Reverse transcriptase zinc-binding domain protein n=1 Tax=Hibiscus trionum TaxID=183268 RepID=A0A9W7M2W0_HIBTR|nr:hypothetical protein HRI_002227400 [Hibiscus trionum]